MSVFAVCMSDFRNIAKGKVYKNLNVTAIIFNILAMNGLVYVRTYINVVNLVAQSV